MSEESVKPTGVVRCPRCSKQNVVRSGKEPFRHECLECGQHYIMVMQLVPVDAPKNTALLESPVAERGTRTT